MEDANDIYNRTLAQVNCTSYDCLLTMKAETLTNAAVAVNVELRDMHPGLEGWQWRTVEDGVNLPASPGELFDSKQFHKVPVILGGNRDEGLFQLQMSMGDVVPHNITEEEFDNLEPEKWMDADTLAELKKVYDPSVYEYPSKLGPYSIHYWMHMRFLTEEIPMQGHCGSKWLARKLVDGGSPRVFSFNFGMTPNIQTSLLPSDFGTYFATHNAELGYVLNSNAAISEASPLDHEMGKSMSSAWTNFAITGDPSTDGSVWPQFTKDEEITLVFGSSNSAELIATKDFKKDSCDFQTRWTEKQGGFPGFNPRSDALEPPKDKDAQDKDIDPIISGVRIHKLLHVLVSSIFFTWMLSHGF